MTRKWILKILLVLGILTLSVAHEQTLYAPSRFITAVHILACVCLGFELLHTVSNIRNRYWLGIVGNTLSICLAGIVVMVGTVTSTGVRPVPISEVGSIMRSPLLPVVTTVLLIFAGVVLYALLRPPRE